MSEAMVLVRFTRSFNMGTVDFDKGDEMELPENDTTLYLMDKGFLELVPEPAPIKGAEEPKKKTRGKAGS